MERRFDTMITAKIILDSINPMDVRLTTHFIEKRIELEESKGE
jgi:hypothetical protein